MHVTSICLAVFFFVCAAAQGQSSGGVAPALHFTYWKAGQGQANTESGTFITNTETTCELIVRVAYEDTQPDTAYTLTRYAWEVSGSHGFTFTGQSRASGAVGTTSTIFSYEGDGTGDEHTATNRSHCPNYRGTATPRNGRNDLPIKITVKFVGYYGTNPNNQQKLTLTKTLTQDVIDQIRQEYLDNRRIQARHKPGDTAIPIPSRSDFSSSNSYNDGHYGQMIDKNLSTKQTHWTQACDKKAKELKASASVTSLTVTGGYLSWSGCWNFYCSGAINILGTNATVRHWPTKIGGIEC